MDDFAACADLCEEHGFPGPAAALRAIGEGRGRYLMVRANVPPEEAIFYGFQPEDIEPPGRKVFLDSAAAERHARELTVRAMRRFAPTEEYARNPSGLSDVSYRRKVGAIFGIKYQYPDVLGTPAFPASATDEQLWQLGQLLHFAPLFGVSAIEEVAG